MALNNAPPIQHPVAATGGMMPQVWVLWCQKIASLAGTGGGGGVTDHGALTGLADDDHTQYHNDTRGDARYSQLGHTHATLPNTAQAVVDFGFASGGEGDTATVTVSAAWVTTSSVIVVTPNATATADHDPDDYAIEGIVAYPTNIVNGIGFDIIAYAPQGTWGRFNVNAIGVA